MQTEVEFFPARASSAAGEVDTLYFFVFAVSALFAASIFVCIFVFAIRYRRRAPGRPEQGAGNVRVEGHLALEIVWTAVPLVLAMAMFAWGAQLYFAHARPPSGAMEVHVVGKQWMWKLQHQTGQREINELHVPVGRPVRLTLTSEDVIHSFFVPAFRLKQDAVPGRYTALWFRATRPGTYRLFCAEYCGTGHSAMIGRVIVLEPRGFEEWLAGGAGAETLAGQGRRLFQTLGCGTCHTGQPGARAPDLRGLFGGTAKLADGREAVVDEAYLRESILTPTAKLVAGFEPIMPTYQGQVTEEGVLQLIEYIKGLK